VLFTFGAKDAECCVPTIISDDRKHYLLIGSLPSLHEKIMGLLEWKNPDSIWVIIPSALHEEQPKMLEGLSFLKGLLTSLEVDFRVFSQLLPSTPTLEIYKKGVWQSRFLIRSKKGAWSLGKKNECKAFIAETLNVFPSSVPTHLFLFVNRALEKEKLDAYVGKINSPNKPRYYFLYDKKEGEVSYESN